MRTNIPKEPKSEVYERDHASPPPHSMEVLHHNIYAREKGKLLIAILQQLHPPIIYTRARRERGESSSSGRGGSSVPRGVYVICRMREEEAFSLFVVSPSGVV